jgi:hypothetical protein
LVEDLHKLVGDNPALKVLAQVMEGQEQELSRTKGALRLAEAQGKITKLNEAALAKKRSFPAAVEEELRELLIDTPKKYADKFYGVLSKLADTGFVELGELGRSYRGDGIRSAKLTLDERARKLMSENKDMTYADAVEKATASDRELANEYRAEIMGGE